MKHTTWRRIALSTIAAATASTALTAAWSTGVAERDPVAPALASPLYGVTLPQGFRQWPLIAPALESEPLNELRSVLANATALEAYRAGRLPFPDGSVLVKLAWKRVQSPDFEPASVPGAATTVQVMVKDSTKYAATGGWGFGRFVDGRPADLAQHETCFACHAARVSQRDYVFTRLAP